MNKGEKGLKTELDIFKMREELKHLQETKYPTPLSINLDQDSEDGHKVLTKLKKHITGRNTIAAGDSGV